MNKVILVGRTIEVPSPLEVQVIFYMKKITLKNGNVIVSGPSRGMIGFLQPETHRNVFTLANEFPSPLEVYMVFYTKMNKVLLVGRTVFPSPLEVQMVFYLMQNGLTKQKVGFRPLSRYRWFSTGGLDD